MVRVKAFPENIPFFGNAIFRKRKCFHVFGCISKNFPKNIFWCLEKKKEKTNPANTDKTQKKPRKKKSSTIDARLGSTARCFASSSPTTAPSITINGVISPSIDGAISQRRDHDLHEIAIDGAISQSVNHDFESQLSDWSSRDQCGLELGVRQRSSDWIGARSSTIARSLSLSLSFSENTLK